MNTCVMVVEWLWKMKIIVIDSCHDYGGGDSISADEKFCDGVGGCGKWILKLRNLK